MPLYNWLSVGRFLQFGCWQDSTMPYAPAFSPSFSLIQCLPLSCPLHLEAKWDLALWNTGARLSFTRAIALQTALKLRWCHRPSVKAEQWWYWLCMRCPPCWACSPWSAPLPLPLLCHWQLSCSALLVTSGAKAYTKDYTKQKHTQKNEIRLFWASSRPSLPQSSFFAMFCFLCREEKILVGEKRISYRLIKPRSDPCAASQVFSEGPWTTGQQRQCGGTAGVLAWDLLAVAPCLAPGVEGQSTFRLHFCTWPCCLPHQRRLLFLTNPPWKCGSRPLGWSMLSCSTTGQWLAGGWGVGLCSEEMWHQSPGHTQQ